MFSGVTVRRRCVGGDEVDAFTKWRHVYCYLQRAGVASRIKRQANRRERREAMAGIRSDEW